MTTKCKVLRGKCAQKWARQAHLRPTNAKKWAALPPPIASAAYVRQTIPLVFVASEQPILLLC